MGGRRLRHAAAEFRAELWSAFRNQSLRWRALCRAFAPAYAGSASDRYLAVSGTTRRRRWWTPSAWRAFFACLRQYMPGAGSRRRVQEAPRSLIWPLHRDADRLHRQQPWTAPSGVCGPGRLAEERGFGASLHRARTWHCDLAFDAGDMPSVWPIPPRSASPLPALAPVAGRDRHQARRRRSEETPIFYPDRAMNGEV